MATPEAEVEGVARVDEKSSSDPEKVYSLEKGPQDDVKTGQSPELLPDYENSSDVVGSADDLVTHVIQVEDDPSIYPWTFRMLFLGVGLSVFGGVLQEIFYRRSSASRRSF
ncbi:hypothetical protein VTN96DRAFT_6224 [Rasamsonia emersonii]